MPPLQTRTFPDAPAGLPDPGCCLLCKGPNSIVAIYEPGPARQAKFRPRPKGLRLFVYGLCVECSRLPDVCDQVERRIEEPLELARLAGRG